MKIAYINSDDKIKTGAWYINDLIILKLEEEWVKVKRFYPEFPLIDTPKNFKGINDILFFYSLLEKRDEILECDIIQWTTYTPIAFTRFSKPIISHFGSTNTWFLKSVPKTKLIEKECRDIFYCLKKDKVIWEVDFKSLRPLSDIATIENYAAQKADFIIATSKIVKNELIEVWIEQNKIEIIHNAIEDYWFNTEKQIFSKNPSIIFLGRIWEDIFTLKLKWLDRLIYLYQKFPEISKLSIIMSHNKKLINWLKEKIPKNNVESNITKTDIPNKLLNQEGSIILITSRYEWFSLSLVEWMSQWLIPIIFEVWVAPEIIINWENWFIVNSIYEAEEKINLLLNDLKLRKKLSKNAKETSMQFKSEILSWKIMKLYKKILKII